MIEWQWWFFLTMALIGYIASMDNLKHAPTPKERRIHRYAARSLLLYALCLTIWLLSRIL